MLNVHSLRRVVRRSGSVVRRESRDFWRADLSPPRLRLWQMIMMITVTMTSGTMTATAMMAGFLSPPLDSVGVGSGVGVGDGLGVGD